MGSEDLFSLIFLSSVEATLNRLKWLQILVGLRCLLLLRF